MQECENARMRGREGGRDEEKSAGLVMRPSGEKVKKTEVKKVREEKTVTLHYLRDYLSNP
jgi:hypothetical protein